MSLTVPPCKTCSQAAQCERVAWFRAGDRSLFAVSWTCARCGPVRLVVSPLGPTRMDAARATCVHCGMPGAPPPGACRSCGFAVDEILSRAEQAQPDAALLALARDAFFVGTCRRALSIVNFVLARNPASADAATMVADFVAHLDTNGAFTT